MKLNNYTLEGIEELKDGLRDFIADLHDPVFWLAMAFVLGIFAGLLFGWTSR